MLTDKESTLSLRIFSKTLNCAEISRTLDWEPSEKFEIGDLSGGRSGKHPREESLWTYKLDLNEKLLFEEQLSILINMLSKKGKKFKKILKNCQVDIFCGYTTYNGQGGFALESKLMKKLASLDIDLVVNFYALGRKVKI